jgi:tetratricopeptide (TPR) repeat protein
MTFPRALMACLAPIALCACAGVSGGPPDPATDVGAGASPYGLFLAGQAAENYGQSGEAANLFAEAARAGGETSNPLLEGQAFISALLAGDVSRAAATAPRGPEVEPGLARLGDLVVGVNALAHGEGRLAKTDFVQAEGSAATETAAALLIPFAAAEAGQAEASVDQPVIAGAPVAQFYARLDQGKLFEHARRWDEAETAYRALIAKGDPGALASLQLGAMLERRGKDAEAAAIYDQALARDAGDPSLLAARARVAAHRPAPPEPSLRRSAAEALIAPASLLVARKEDDVALAYLRLALDLDSTRDEAWILIGDILEGQGDAAASRAAYLKAAPGSPQYADARAKLAWSYQSGDEKAEALAVARQTLKADPGSEAAAVNLAELLQADGQYAESATLLDGLVARGGDHPNWLLLYMRANDYQESGRWSDAEQDIKRALALRPDEPELLNFLGYSWIDRGEKLPEALAMVKKAVDLDPQSGAMIDSLGWGYYRMGDYRDAVEKLEAAVLLEPADPDVNNHLGDAYWRVGRKLEARFQWQRVLTLDPSPKLKADVEAKLKSGLDGEDRPDLVADQQSGQP